MLKDVVREAIDDAVRRGVPYRLESFVALPEWADPGNEITVTWGEGDEPSRYRVLARWRGFYVLEALPC